MISHGEEMMTDREFLLPKCGASKKFPLRNDTLRKKAKLILHHSRTFFKCTIRSLSPTWPPTHKVTLPN